MRFRCPVWAGLRQASRRAKRLTGANARYNELKALLKSAAAAAAEQAEPRDDARHIRAAMNRRLTPSLPGGDEVRARAGSGRTPPGSNAACMPCRPRIAQLGGPDHRKKIPRGDAPRSRRTDARALRAGCPRPRIAPQESGGDLSARFMAMLEADLERAGKFVALQVDDIQLRSRALAARAAAAATPAELDRIEGA